MDTFFGEIHFYKLHSELPFAPHPDLKFRDEHNIGKLERLCFDEREQLFIADYELHNIRSYAGRALDSTQIVLVHLSWLEMEGWQIDYDLTIDDVQRESYEMNNPEFQPGAMERFLSWLDDLPRPLQPYDLWCDHPRMPFDMESLSEDSASEESDFDDVPDYSI